MISNHPKRLCSQSISPSKAKETCVACLEIATEDIMEYVWCDGCVHRNCTKISADQCAVLNSVASNIAFFCNSSVSKLPATLDSYDNQTYFESSMSSLEDKVNEMQAAEKQLHESVKNIESQLKEYHSSITNVDGNQILSVPAPVTPTSMPC